MEKKKNRGGGGGGEGGGGAGLEAAAAASIVAGSTIKASSSGFRFQDGVVEDELVKDMKSLKALSIAQVTRGILCAAARATLRGCACPGRSTDTGGQVEEVVSMSLAFLTSTDASALVDAAQIFSETHAVNLAPIKATLRGLLIFFKGAARKHLSKALVQDDLVLFGLDQDQAVAAAQLWHAHLQSLSSSIADNTLRVNRLVDMDWRFGVTSSSSEMQQVGRTFLQLRLGLDRGGGHTQTSCMELTLPQFYEFLQEMEKAKASMDFLS